MSEDSEKTKMEKSICGCLCGSKIKSDETRHSQSSEHPSCNGSDSQFITTQPTSQTIRHELLYSPPNLNVQRPVPRQISPEPHQTRRKPRQTHHEFPHTDNPSPRTYDPSQTQSVSPQTHEASHQRHPKHMRTIQERSQTHYDNHWRHSGPPQTIRDPHETHYEPYSIHPEPAPTRVHSQTHYDPRKRHSEPPQTSQRYRAAELPRYPLGSRVRIINQPYFIGGSIAWTGYPVIAETQDDVVVIRLDEHHPQSSNGEFWGQRLVPYQPENEYLMVNSSALELVPEIIHGDFYMIRKGSNIPTTVGGFARKSKGFSYDLYPIDTVYCELEMINCYNAEDFLLFQTPPPESEIRSEYCRAVQVEWFPWAIGRNKGIQGQSNSCYLDTFLFAFFAFSEHLDDLLFSDRNIDYSSWDTLSVLRYNIVYPLRSHLYVSHDKVEELRNRLVAFTNTFAYQHDPRDIQECMETLFGKIFCLKPTLSIGNLDGNQTHFYDSFCIEIIGETTSGTLNVQQLLEHAAVILNFCVQEVNKWFMIQLPRESQHSITAIPSLELDLNNVLFKTPKLCFFCKNEAALRFGDCMTGGDIRRTWVCRACAGAEGLHIRNAATLPTHDGRGLSGRSTVVHLSALICIESSHYNCFVRCGRGERERWAFFDSMSDRVEYRDPTTNTPVQYNIPLIRYIPNFRKWVTIAQQFVNKGESLDRFFETVETEDKDLCKRIFTCPYALIYEEFDDTQKVGRITDI